MKKTAVATDSNSGITQSEGKQLGIFVIPMPFLINDENYYEDINLSQDKFYQKLTADENVSTSQPIVGELISFFDSILKEYEEVIYIPMSSGLSQSCATATTLAEDYHGKIQVVDNKRISVTQRESVMDALTLVQKGKRAKEIKKILMTTSMDASIYIMLDTLKYLKKGGRITPAAAAVGSVLKLKPVLQIQGEKLDKFCMSTRTVCKAKDVMINAIKNDFTQRFANLIENKEMGLAIAHTNNLEEAEKFKEEVRAVFPNIPICFCDSLSLSISCHIGPGALAVACFRIIQ